MSYLVMVALFAVSVVFWIIVIREVFVKNVVDLVALLNASQARVDQKRAAVAEIERRVGDAERARNDAMRAYGASKAQEDCDRWDEEDRLLSSLVTSLNERRAEFKEAVADYDALRTCLHRRARRGGYLLRFRRSS